MDIKTIRQAHGDCSTHIPTSICWLISEIESLDQSLESIALALDGLPITGERTGPRSVKYLDFADQIKALREKLVTRDAAICEMKTKGEKAIGDLFDCLEGVEIEYPVATKPAGIMATIKQIIYSLGSTGQAI